MQFQLSIREPFSVESNPTRLTQTKYNHVEPSPARSSPTTSRSLQSSSANFRRGQPNLAEQSRAPVYPSQSHSSSLQPSPDLAVNSSTYHSTRSPPSQSVRAKPNRTKPNLGQLNPAVLNLTGFVSRHFFASFGLSVFTCMLFKFTGLVRAKSVQTLWVLLSCTCFRWAWLYLFDMDWGLNTIVAS